MILTYILVAFVIVLAIVASLVSKKRSPSSGDWPFYARKLLSAPEQVLYRRLVKALPDHIVLAQVQMSRVLGVKKGNNFHQWNNRINRLSYDFVVCTKDCSTVAAIELDDKSHRNASRAETDAKKERATKAAGIPLIRWQVKALPDADAIRSTILPHAVAMKRDRDPAETISIRAER
ncbi:MAG: DUF2726 domain-containing protein [Terriglobia bacterium]